MPLPHAPLDIAIEREKNGVAARLRPVSSDMSAADFELLVDRVARVNLKYRNRTGDYAPPLGQRSDG